MQKKSLVKYQSQSDVTKIQLEILKIIASGSTNTRQIAIVRRKSVRNTYKVLNRLVSNGFLRKIGTDFLLSQSSKNIVAVAKENYHNKVRLHDVKVRIKILSKYDQDKTKLLLLNHYKTKTIQLKNNKQITFSLSQLKCAITTKSVIITMPSIIANNPTLATAEMMEILFDMIPKLENRLKLILIKDGYLNIEILSQHCAMMENAMAKLYNKEGNKFLIKDPEDGKTRLIIDNSFKLNEFEAVHPNKAISDMQNLQPFFLGLVEKSPSAIEGMLRSSDDIKIMAKVITELVSQRKEQIQTNSQLTEISKGMFEHLRILNQTNSEILYHLETLKGINIDRKNYFG